MLTFMRLLLFMCHFHDTCVKPLLMIHMYHLVLDPLSLFRISDWSCVSNYTKDMPCVFFIRPAQRQLGDKAIQSVP